MTEDKTDGVELNEGPVGIVSDERSERPPLKVDDIPARAGALLDEDAAESIARTFLQDDIPADAGENPFSAEFQIFDPHLHSVVVRTYWGEKFKWGQTFWVGGCGCTPYQGRLWLTRSRGLRERRSSKHRHQPLTSEPRGR